MLEATVTSRRWTDLRPSGSDRSNVSSPTKRSSSEHIRGPDNDLVGATDDLIALYRGIERRAIDLPLISVTPFLISAWAGVKFVLLLYIGIILIIPVNFLILIRNLFPGRWRYRPFFLAHLHYAWLWILRGEAPTTPGILFRPLLHIFLKAHFASRLRRLRLEIILRDGLSEATRSALVGRVDAALERWKSQRFAGILYTGLLPAFISFPTWYQGVLELQQSLGIAMPLNTVATYVADMSGGHVIIFGALGLGYLLAIPITAFLGKRGLFIGQKSNRICFPGGHEGSGAYRKEAEILGVIAVRSREMPTDLWLLTLLLLICSILVFVAWPLYEAAQRSLNIALIGLLDPDAVTEELLNQSAKSAWIVTVSSNAFLAGLTAVSAFRRRRTGRS